jgi:uncharacterized YccA/Bax inhibitor family protein
MESANPFLNKQRLARMTRTMGHTATIEGTMTNASLLLLLMVVFGGLSWFAMDAGYIPSWSLIPMFILAFVGGLGIAIALAFKPQWAPTLAPVYAGLQGLFLGMMSLLFESFYNGIVIHAILLTTAVALLMFTLYRTQVIKVTQKFRTVIIIATLSIMLVYVVSFAMSFFTTKTFAIHQSGTIGILFSLFVVTIAALFLLLDFDLIERAEREGMPKYMEWLGAFALMVTIVWLYIEILKLLAKLRDN